MPGKRVTDHQVIKYKQLRQRLGQEAAAAKIGISERTARRLERLDRLPSQRGPRTWRTRSDPLAAVWDAEVLPMLRSAPGLAAVTVLEELQRRYEGAYPNGVLRTLQRRIRHWRALEGPEREVYFAQQHEPGRLGLSDFTHARELEVRIAQTRVFAPSAGVVSKKTVLSTDGMSILKPICSRFCLMTAWIFWRSELTVVV